MRKGENMTGGEISLSYEQNRNMIVQTMSLFDAPDIDLQNPEEVKQRITAYFDRCIELQLRPGNMGLYSALGISRQQAHNIVSGRDKVSPLTRDTIKKAQRALSAYREMLGNSGKINPITLIFWQKNFDGLVDVTSLEVSRNDIYSQEKAHLTPEQIQEQIEKDIPVDVADDYDTAQVVIGG